MHTQHDLKAQKQTGNCHFDAFFRSSIGLEKRSSEDNKLSLWSESHHSGLVRNKSLDQTPNKNVFVAATDLSASHQSPKETKRMGYAKDISSPRTPEQLMSGSMLHKNDEHLI